MQELFLNAYLAYRSDRAYAADAARVTLSETLMFIPQVCVRQLYLEPGRGRLFAL